MELDKDKDKISGLELRYKTWGRNEFAVSPLAITCSQKARNAEL